MGTAGERFSWWIRPGSGRAYLGFGASSSGCWSVVAAPNTGEFMIQQNAGYDFNPVATTNQTWQAGKWYKVTVEFASTSSVNCNLYDSDGTTLLNSLTYSGITGLPGGVAMRSFSGFSGYDLFRKSKRKHFHFTNQFGEFCEWRVNGYITVFNRATNLVLTADDGNGHTGSSNPFDVAPADMAPVILMQPANQTVIVGRTVSFNVTADGTPPLNYQWNFSGTNIAGATNTTLTLTNVQLNQAGNYTVWVTNTYGSVLSSNAALTVNPPPPCTPAPSNMVAWWRAEGNALDSVWTNNGSPVGALSYTNGEVGQAFVFDGSTSYIPVPASPSLDVGTGSGFTIECWVHSSSAGILAPWWSGIQSARTVCNCGSMAVWIWRSTSRTRRGEHKFNTAAGVLSTSELRHVAFTYDRGSGAAVLYVNGSVMTATNFGNVIPQTTYALNIGRRLGQPIGYGDTYGGLLDELSLYNRALASNEVAAIYIAGSGGKCPPTPAPPSITTQPANQTVIVGGMATFSVTASGTLPLSYQWRFGGTNITGATNTTLTLTNVQFSQAGNYAVLVTNLYGSALSSNAVLTVTSPPTCDPAPSGMVAWWRAEGNALDSMGTNNGSPAGGILTPMVKSVRPLCSTAAPATSPFQPRRV